MKTHNWRDIRNKNLSPERLASLEKEVRNELAAIELRELRELAGKTQAEVAEILEQTQSQLSRTESREDHLVSTLRRYVQALGGDLEVVAVIGNKRVVLSGV